MSNLLKDLNKQQLSAVTHKSGPCLVVAGAGTGKTTVITHRIAHIISKKWAKPSEILALTFTDKAAHEMEQRVDLLVPYGFVDTQISTFHAFGDRTLRDYALDIGLPANFKILSATEQAIFLRQSLFSFDLKYFRPISNPTTYIDEILKHFSRLKDELVSPEQYLKYAEGLKKKTGHSSEDRVGAEKTLELANAYQRYQDLMIQSGNLDYGDQIFLTYKLLKENKKILSECQERFKYILVDEFQDTNFAQYQIVKLLSSTHKNLMVVGDDDQSIYRFRGASISNILFFKKDYPKCRQIVLNQNYRSTWQILDSAYKLIQHNNPDRLEVKNKIDKRLVSQKSGQKPELLHCDTLTCEADMLVKKIAELIKQKGLSFNDFAVLSRANSHLEPFMHTLSSKKIPFAFAGTSSLYENPEIKMLVAFMRCLVYPDDNKSFYQLATSELYNIDDEVIAGFYARTKRENRNFEEIFVSSQEPKIPQILNDIKSYRAKIRTLSSGELLYAFLKEKKYLARLAQNPSAEAEAKIQNIAKFFDRIVKFDRTSSDKSLLAFLENLEMILAVADEPMTSDIDPDLDAVNLMTVHAAKGLEWPVVFIVNCVSDRFPSRDRRERIPIPDDLIKEKLPEGDHHLQEERRLFYVGSTRAKDYLFLTSADDYGGKRAKKISQFALELLDEPNLIKQKYKLSALEKINLHDRQAKKVVLPLKSQKGTDGLLRLTQQQIDDYYTCPKKYYYASVVKIPLPTNWHFAYGTAIHEAIGRYYSRKISGLKPDLKSLIGDYEQAFVSEGYITREHEEQRRKKGIETLTKFFDEDKKLNLMPAKVEERFEFELRGARVTGRYDLITGKGESVEIRDFKTSDVKDQKHADQRVKDSIQMMIYALAWRKKHDVTPETTLVFIESDLTATKKIATEEISEIENIIENVARGIKDGNFKAKPDSRQCTLCSYHDICPESSK